MEEEETDVVVLGSGFGGSVAALRFAEAGHRVVVLERGGPVSRETFQADLDFLWHPEKGRFGFHELRARGRVVPWLGAAVGGGSHVYAGTLKRTDRWDGFPQAIRDDDLAPHYERAETMLGATPYPDYEPYASVRATRLLLEAGARLRTAHPELVDEAGPLPLGISFAPPGGEPGAEFVNKHGAPQRYSDPREQSLLGGDIDAKNSLDRNYLFLAGRAGAEVRPFSEADRIERLDDGRFRVEYARRDVERTIVARRVVVACGAIGSTELLLRNRDVHHTLPLGAALGRRYSTNGNFISLLLPYRWVAVSWAGFALLAISLALGWAWGIAAGLLVYYGALFNAEDYQPDAGTTNSDGLALRGRDGRPRGAFVEGGRYPNPGQVAAAAILSALAGRFHPRRFRWIRVVGAILRWGIPPLGAIARSFPIPLLCMGHDDAQGEIHLDGDGRAVIAIDLARNATYYAWLDTLGRDVARAARALWLRNPAYALTTRFEVPHNLGGVPMGETAADGVVDHAGRVFGIEHLYVIDGSIVPVAIGPNPALTITALAERAMTIILQQSSGTVTGGASSASSDQNVQTAPASADSTTN